MSEEFEDVVRGGLGEPTNPMAEVMKVQTAWMHTKTQAVSVLMGFFSLLLGLTIIPLVVMFWVFAWGYVF